MSDKLGELDSRLDLNRVDYIHNKETYSMVNKPLIDILHRYQINEVILTGMETQWCINQTTRDLVDLNYRVNIPVDAVGNNRDINSIPLERIKSSGGRLCLVDDIIAENLVSFNDRASKWFVNYLKTKSKV